MNARSNWSEISAGRVREPNAGVGAERAVFGLVARVERQARAGTPGVRVTETGELRHAAVHVGGVRTGLR